MKRAPLVLSLLVLAGCPKGDKSAATGDAETTSADAHAPAQAASAAATGHVIAGVGEVPHWAADKNSPKCTAPAGAAARLAVLKKGEDAALTGGTADVAALTKELAGDCGVARKDLAQSLNDGGYMRYSKKKYGEANRWWRAALTVRPAFILSRYNLACSLVLDGKPKDGVDELKEIAKAAQDGDAQAANIIEKAKSDADLVSVREDAAFKEILKASTGTLVGPRKEPETAAAAVKLLPEAFRKVTDENVGAIVYNPAVLQVWTWRPTAAQELVVATVIDDPAKMGKPKGDMNRDYGGILVLRRDGEKLKLLFAQKTGESFPNVASGKANTVAYSYDAACGTLKGSLAWDGTKVSNKEQTCQDL